MRRVLLTPDTLRVSLPGVDVFNPPSLTSKHLAIDSSWARAARLVTLAAVLDTSLASDTNVFFALQDTPPLATFVRSSGATIFDDTIEVTNLIPNSPLATQTHFISKCRRNVLVLSRQKGPQYDKQRYNFHVLVFRDGNDDGVYVST